MLDAPQRLLGLCRPRLGGARPQLRRRQLSLDVGNAGLCALHGSLGRLCPRPGLVQSCLGGALLDLGGADAVFRDLQFLDRPLDQFLGARLELGRTLLRWKLSTFSPGSRVPAPLM